MSPSYPCHFARLDYRPARAAARGYILLPVVIGITMIATIALLLNLESGNEASQSGAELQTSQVNYIAEAAYTHALWHVDNHTCSGDLTVQNTLGDHGHYTAQLDTQASTVNRYSLFAIADTYIDEDNKSRTHGNEAQIRVRNQNNRELQGLFRFNLSAIPETARVVEATAWFYLTHSEPDTVLTVHAVEESWTEANATWNRIDEDFDEDPFAIIAPRPTSGAWIAVNLMELVEEWVDDADDNFGLLIRARQEGGETRFAAREADISLRARLDVVTANSSVSPVQVTTTATLTGNLGPANDISRSQTRSGIKAYQTPVEHVLQPGPLTGKDTRIDEWRPTRNDGNSRWIEVNSGTGSTSHSLLQFAVDIPEDARIESAILSLYHHSAGSGGIANVRRVTRSWEAGTGPGSSGATWLRRGSSGTWNNPGADLHSRIYASTAIASGAEWVSWEIADLVQGWVDDSYSNEGLALVPASPTTALRFDSSDTPDVLRRPMLTIIYRCECGNPCRPEV